MINTPALLFLSLSAVSAFRQSISKRAFTGNRYGNVHLSRHTKSVNYGKDSILSKQVQVKSNKPSEISAQPSSSQGFVVLSLVPLIWGTYSPIIRYAYELHVSPPPELLNFAFYVVSVSFLLLTNAVTSNTSFPSRKTFMAGLDLGTWLFLGSTFQLNGLKHTSGTHAAIIVQLTSIIVPVIEAIYLKGKSSNRLWVGVLASFFGIILLTTDKTMTGGATFDFKEMLLGDSLVLAAACFYSTHVIRLGSYAKEFDSLKLAGSKQIAQLLFTSAFAGIPAVISATRLDEYQYFLSELDRQEVGTLALVALWNGIFSSAFTSWAQSYGQRVVSPTIASLLFTAQPLWSALFCRIFLHEMIGTQGFAGIGIVLAALAYSLTGTNSLSQEANASNLDENTSVGATADES